MISKEKNFVSCVVYMHNDEKYIKEFLKRIVHVINQNFEKYEIVCVNDGSVDESIVEVKNFLKDDNKEHVVSLINLSYYQGVETAMNAGRDLAVGDFLFEFDSCLMDFEPELIMEVYRKSLEGFDVVAAAPKRYVPLTSRLFYWIYNLGSYSSGKLRQERFRIISRRAINRVNQLNTYIPYRKALYANCGLKMDTILYDNKERSKINRNREERGNRNTLAMDTVIIFTNILEKLSILLSVVFFAILLYVFGDIIYTLFSDTKPVEGWLSLMGMMSLGFFMLFVMLTLIFKYLSLILNISFKKQRYVIEGVEKLTK